MAEGSARPARDRRSLARWVGKQTVFCLLVAAALFWPSGDTAWLAGWLYVGVCVAAQVATAAVLLPVSPQLLVDRSGISPGAKGWDIPLALLVGYSPLFLALAAGLEHPAGTSLGLPAWAAAVAILVIALATGFTLWAMAVNRHFSPVVTIEPEKGHTVVDRGPYGWVRHPGYVGSLIFALAAPFLLDSAWAAATAVGVLAVTALRTALEDRALQRELPGYREYAGRVRWRLVPGVW